MATELKTLTNADPEFYRLVGPFLARREVHKQLGGPIYDDDGKTWIVAVDRRKVVAFIGVRTERGIAVAESCYLTDGNEDLLPLLIRAAISTVAPTPVRATVRKDRFDAYQDAGFVEAGATNGFVKLVYKPAV